MKKTILVLLLGLLLRLFLMPFTVHPDLRGHYLGAYFMAKKGAWLTMYDYISWLPRDNPLVVMYQDSFFVYSPLTYLLHATALQALSPLINWPLFSQFELDIGSAVRQPGFPMLAFLLKLPYLLADVACVVALFKLVNPKQRFLASVLWSFNLPLLHSAFMMGQFDIFMIMFILFGLVAAKKRHYSWTAILFALAAGFKPYPLFFLPFIPGNKIKNILIGALAYLAIIAPYLGSPGYRMYALVAQHSDKMWYAKVMVSGSQYLPIFLVWLGVLFWANWLSPKRLNYWEWPLLSLLGFYSVVHYHPQWFAWVTPFLALAFLNYRQLRPLLAFLLLCDIGITFSFETSLNFGLFGIDFNLFDFINRYYPKDQLISFIRGAIAATSIVIAGFLSKNSRQEA